ncbi:MAG: helix-turn-helix domain-containing protein [Rhodobacteraceae bacterium]|jgi:IclR family mhp operon transcriptional activator|nr:helix-turn-helix domain-containing protein [Paracoccaceae bacterium]
MPSFEPVRAIVRGLQILRVISESGPISTTDIAKQLKLPQPTVVRMLETLVSAGYVYRLEKTAVFGVTARTLTLSKGFAATSRLVQLATPLIENLRSEIGWPSNLATYEQGAMSIAYTNRSEQGMSIAGRLGARLPVLATGVGMAYLAHLSRDELDTRLAEIRRSDSRWDSNPEMLNNLDQRLAKIRDAGYALAEQSYLDEIYHSQIWAVALPVIVDGRVVAGLSSLMLRSAGDTSHMLSKVLPPLRQAANEIAARLAEDAGVNDGPDIDEAKPPRKRRKAPSAL